MKKFYLLFAGTLLSVFSFAQVNLEQGLVAYYPFTNGSVDDFSSNGNDGTLSGAVPAVDRFGSPNCAYDFDGENDYIRFTESFDINPRSVMAWLCVDQFYNPNANYRVVLTNDGNSNGKQYGSFGIIVRRENNINKVFLQACGSESIEIDDVNIDEWNFAAMIANNNFVYYYWNGEFVGSNEMNNSCSNSSNGFLRFGEHRDEIYFDKNRSFDGKLDDVRIYDRELTESEVQALYNEGGYNPLQQGLVAHYPFNGNANDESGNGNDGVVNGATLTTDRFGNANSTYEFDGVDDYINTNTDFGNEIIGNGFTISFWINALEIQNLSWLFGEDFSGIQANRSFAIQVESSKKIKYEIFDNGNNINYFYSNTAITENNWEFITCTWDGDLLKGFINSSEEGSIAVSSMNNCTYLSWIGLKNSSNRPYKGKIDDIRIYNRALTQSEILTLYNEGGLPYTSLNGTITDNSTGNPIENAQIVLTKEGNNWYQATSNNQGYYEIQNIESGNYNIDVTKSGYISDNMYVNLTSQSTYTEDFSLLPSNVSSLEITDGFLTAYADNITELEQNYYNLSGNVNINGILYFDGEVLIDKRNNLEHPLIIGSSGPGMFAHDIAGEDKWFLPHYIPFIYYADDNQLIIDDADFLSTLDIELYGFPVKLPGMTIDVGGENIYLHVLPEFSWPLNLVMDENSSDNLPFMIENLTMDIIMSHPNGIVIAGELTNLNANAIAFKLNDVHVIFNSDTNYYYGAFTLQIPGKLKDNKTGDNLNESAVADTLFSDGMTNVPVDIVDEDGNLIKQTDFDGLLEMQKAFGLAFLKLQMEVEFVEGSINKLIVTISSKIAIGPTGLFITEMTGGVDDLTDKDNWRIIANVDIETALELPDGTAPIKLDDFGVNIHPWSYFQGSGAFLVFDNEVSNGMIEYDGNLKSLSGEFNLNLQDILVGHAEFGLSSGQFTGAMDATLTTPNDLLWWLDWAENTTIGSAQADVNNYYIRSLVDLSGLSLAQKMEFGKETFPWFHYYIGTNYDHMAQIWKGMKDGKQSVTFQVFENTGQVIIVAGDTIAHQSFDFTVTDPLGNLFDQNNTNYSNYPGTDQTVMIIDNPTTGDWDFQTTYAGDIILETKGINQSPMTLLDEPLNKKSKSNQISLDFTDYSDTLNVIVFYDTDNKHFDGAVIDTFEIVNNATVDFLWQNEDIPNGEYYIYCRIDDGYNTPVLQYAPGSILVMNDLNIETPQNIAVVQQADSVLVNWDAPTYENTIASTVYYRKVSNGFTDEVSVSDTNFVTLKNLENGMEYEIWCKFINDNGTFSEKSNIVNLIFSGSMKNNPPYFKMPTDSIWVFIENEAGNYDLLANDADGETLIFALPDDTLGMQINGDKLSWTPTNDDRGFFNILITVTDGAETDSTWQKLIVYTQEQVDVDLMFSSLNLYEDDNMFIKLKNFKQTNTNETVTLTNISTLEQTTVSCRKVNQFDFIGKFDLSYAKKTSITVNNGDTIIASYTYGTNTYTAMAYYDSLPQPFDKIAPADITDLSVNSYEGNKVKLLWTASGNDADTGSAYRYDIRYSYSPILSENDYLVANIIEQVPYPSIAGVTDSLIIDLSTFADIIYNDTVFFSIKAEDEMQNRSGISNNASIEFYLAADEPTVNILDVYKINFSWNHPAVGNKGATNLQAFRIYRKFNENNFVQLTDTVTTLSFTDDLYAHPDGKFQYAVQAIFTTGVSNIVYSDTIMMNRFTELKILSNLDDTLNNSGVVVNVTGLDTIYGQVYSDTTNPTGLLIYGNVFKSQYKVEVQKDGYDSIVDTILVTDGFNEFNYTLYRNSVEFDIKVFLEGPFNGVSMDANLNPDNIPLVQPYNVDPWNYAGTEYITIVPNNNIVDWVLVELRETNGVASTAISDSVISRKAGFVLDDGTIVDRDGSTSLHIVAEINDDLYMVIWHRNHLGVMSAVPLTESNGVYSYDFTDAADKAYGVNPQKELSPGIWGMMASDGDANGQVNIDDKDNVWAPQAGEKGYRTGDFNMDTEVDNNDKNDVWVPNDGKGSEVPE